MVTAGRGYDRNVYNISGDFELMGDNGYTSRVLGCVFNVAGAVGRIYEHCMERTIFRTSDPDVYDSICADLTLEVHDDLVRSSVEPHGDIICETYIPAKQTQNAGGSPEVGRSNCVRLVKDITAYFYGGDRYGQ
jgi:hypothetical protein